MSIAKDTAFWDRASRKYAASKIGDPAGYQRTLDRTRDLLSPQDRVLELGCGTGSTALVLADAVDSYLATDISPDMIAIAQGKLAETPRPGLQFRAATTETLDEADGFSAVLGFNYLHMVRDLPATLRRIHALLEPGGLFISKTACLGDMTWLLRGLALPVMQALGKAPHVGNFTADQLVRQIQDAGFEITVREIHASKGSDKRPYIVARKV